MPDAAPGLPALHGVRVLDLTQVIAGPFCTQMLADAGAEVVKIEPPGRGDDLRTTERYRGRAAHDEDYFYTLNRRKQSVVLDLKDAAQRATAQALAARADVLVQNFAPGTAERLGMGYADLSRRNPRLIYCAISGFGQTGPYADRPAMDPIIQGMCGLMSVTGEPDGQPLGVGMPISDSITGLFAAFAIVNALHAARRDGRGTYLDVAMLDAMLSILSPRMGEALQAGLAAGRFGNENPVRVPTGMFVCGDGQYLNLVVQSDRQWPAFCRALGREEWVDDPRFATMGQRLRNRDELRGTVAERLLDEPAEEWTRRLLAEKVPAGPVLDYLQAVADPQVRHRGLIVEVDHPRSGPIKLIGLPWHDTAATPPPLTPPPLLGEHTQAVIDAWLGEE